VDELGSTTRLSGFDEAFDTCLYQRPVLHVLVPWLNGFKVSEVGTLKGYTID
jgi:hypothetical protein